MSETSTYKMTESDIALFNKIKNQKNKTNSIVLFISAIVLFIDFIALVLIGLFSWIKKFNHIINILDHKYFLIAQFLILLFPILSSLVIFITTDIDNIKIELIEVYKKATRGTNISFETIKQNELTKNSKIDDSVAEQNAINIIESNNYYDVFKNYINKEDLDLMDTNKNRPKVIGGFAIILLAIYLIYIGYKKYKYAISEEGVTEKIKAKLVRIRASSPNEPRPLTFG